VVNTQRAKAGFARQSTEGSGGRSVMTDRDMIIGRLINVTGMIGVLAGVILFTFAIVLLLFRRGFGFDIASSFLSGFGSFEYPT
jgi:hypothetical protein